MGEELPEWARRIKALREARGLSQTQAAEGMRTHSDKELPSAENILRRWKAWERGENKPRDYISLIAATLGTVSATIFPPEPKAPSADILTVTGMDTC